MNDETVCLLLCTVILPKIVLDNHPEQILHICA
jgi:hypothetical protein